MTEKERALNTQVEIRDGEGWYKGRYMIVRIDPDGSEHNIVHCADKRNALCYKNYLLSKMQSDLYWYLAHNMGKGVRPVGQSLPSIFKEIKFRDTRG